MGLESVSWTRRYGYSYSYGDGSGYGDGYGYGYGYGSGSGYGSGYGLNYPVEISGDTMTIGCQSHSIDLWLRNWRAIARNHGVHTVSAALLAHHLQCIKDEMTEKDKQ